MDNLNHNSTLYENKFFVRAQVVPYHLLSRNKNYIIFSVHSSIRRQTHPYRSSYNSLRIGRSHNLFPNFRTSLLLHPSLAISGLKPTDDIYVSCTVADVGQTEGCVRLYQCATRRGKSVDAAEPWHAGITCTSAGIRVFSRADPPGTPLLPASRV